jgi:hypothetical protein
MYQPASTFCVDEHPAGTQSIGLMITIAARDHGQR